MANVLNEFLNGVSKGFQDAAFASFSRRRSTVRDDIAQSFAATEPEAAQFAPGGGGNDYLEMLNEPSSGAAEPAPAPKKSSRKKGVVDAPKKKRGGRRRRGRSGSGLREI
jgi:hypothetical protein